MFTDTSTTTPTSPNATALVGGMTTGAKIGTGVAAVGGFAVVGFLVYVLAFLLKLRHLDKINAERINQIHARIANTRSETQGRRGRGSELFLTQTARRDF